MKCLTVTTTMLRQGMRGKAVDEAADQPELDVEKEDVEIAEGAS